MKLTHVIYPNGDFVTTTEVMSEKALREAVRGMPERVAVIFLGTLTLMYVEKKSAVNNLEPNPRATAIYWTATIQGKTGVRFDPLNAPMIHGTAVLLEGVRPY